MECIAEDSETDSCFEVIESWIKSCERDHPDCAQQMTRLLPTRVIDVGKDGKNPRLYESHGEIACYITLSHCWGGKQIITTTKATLEDRKQGITWSSLSKTFQDAVRITQKLGFRYLWVDSLCIVQNDHLDWERESAQMASIYQNSFLTIAATHSADGDGGCFSKRPRSSTDSREIYKGKGVVPAGVIVRRRLPDHRMSVYFDGISSKSPLHSRAWCFQERLLASRTIQYAEDELVWECKTKTWCECMDLDTWHFNTKSFKRHYLESLAAGLEIMGEEWSKIVNLYTARQLSFESDRLPALSGIAKHFQSYGMGSYLAGLWKPLLPRQLLWQVRNCRSARRPLVYRAPSWSWASVEGTDISYAFGGDTSRIPLTTPNVCILDAQCTAKGADPTGQVSDAFLKVSGPLVAASAFVHSNELVDGRAKSYAIERGDQRYVFQPDFPFFEETKSGLPQAPVYCLQISTANYGFQPPMPYGYSESHSLVLARSLRVPDAYERVGFLAQSNLEEAAQLYRDAEDTVLTIV
ncbi:hypothetical protein GP486_004187 [Trichoglossum hirsutum]|uniref:Heterokaryon incompatibility domain-containing protein n=1 Tax=Trichoglossum hirsutum TaxID=265104 RepID=A0A9P8LBF9_9PEZI|nr:hypothetical protein GP486_004187 [Trichoglossum hirsutum]